jgi:hypothetical protein
MCITPVKRANAWWLNGAATEASPLYPVRMSGRARSFDAGSADTGNDITSKLLARFNGHRPNAIRAMILLQLQIGTSD